MAIGQVVTGGLGVAGGLVTTIPRLLLRGLSPTNLSPGIEATQQDSRIHASQRGTQINVTQPNSRLHYSDHGGEW